MAGQVFKRTARADAIWFEVELEDGSTRRFNCRDQIPGGIVLGVANLVSGDKAAQGTAAIAMIQKLLKAAIIKPQRALFWSMVEGEDDDGIIDVPQLIDIATALAEAYTERPTGELSGVGSQTTTDGSDSRVGAPQLESVTYARSPQYEPSTSSNAGVSSPL